MEKAILSQMRIQCQLAIPFLAEHRTLCVRYWIGDSECIRFETLSAAILWACGSYDCTKIDHVQMIE